MQLLQTFRNKYPSFFKPSSKILLACSGGPDSVALARALQILKESEKFQVEIAHVNHKLRGAASEKDARFVFQLARELGWQCHIIDRPLNQLKSGNLEETAREKRYAALVSVAKKRGASSVFTAHTLDDQVETVFMNLMRGTGPDGLAAMAPVRQIRSTSLCLCRPFLGILKKELLNWMAGFKWKFRQDHSNKNKSYLRNWLRADLIPLLEKKSPGFKERMGHLTEIALDEKIYWQQEITSLDQRLFRPYKSGRLLDLGGLLRYSAAVQRRVLRRSLGRDLLTFEAVERLREWMQSPPTGGRLWQLKQGWSVERQSKSKGSSSAQLFWFKQSKIRKDKKFHEKI